MRAMPKKACCLVAALLMMAASVGCHRATGADESDGGVASAEIGIPECDDYVSTYQRCVEDKVPSERREAMKEALVRTRATWKSLAANPGARPGLPQACALARQTAQTTMKQYGCAW
jgi:hypothetical protein